MSSGKAIGLGVTNSFAPPTVLSTAGTTGASLGHAASSAVSAAAPVVAGVAVAFGAVMLTRSALIKLGELDERYTAHTERWLAGEAEATRWQLAYADVVARNARITRLQAALRQIGPGGDSPPRPPDPFEPAQDAMACVTLEMLREWCRGTDTALAEAERWLRQARLAAASLPGPLTTATTRRTVTTLLERHRAAKRQSAPGGRLPSSTDRTDQQASSATRQTGPRVDPLVEATVTEAARAMTEAAQDLPAEMLAELAPLAEGVLAARDVHAARESLYLLYRQVAVCREQLAEQDAEAQQAAVHLTAVAAIVTPDEPLSPGAVQLVARLEDVVARRARLDERDAEDAGALTRELVRRAEERYALRAFLHLLDQRGYALHTDQSRTGCWSGRPAVDRTSDAELRVEWDGRNVRATWTGADEALVEQWKRDLRELAEDEEAGVVVRRIELVERPRADTRPQAASRPELEDDVWQPNAAARPTP